MQTAWREVGSTDDSYNTMPWRYEYSVLLGVSCMLLVLNLIASVTQVISVVHSLRIDFPGSKACRAAWDVYRSFCRPAMKCCAVNSSTPFVIPKIVPHVDIA